MDRTALLAYLAAEWAEIIAEAGIDVDYIADQVEAVFAAQPELDTRWAEPLADYYLLRRAVRAFSIEIDVTIEGDSYRLSQRKQIESLFATRAAEVAWIVSPDGGDGSSIGKVVTIGMPYLTPESDVGSGTW